MANFAYLSYGQLLDYVMFAALLRYKPQNTWPGLILVLLGVPVYLLWARRPLTARE